MLPLKFGPLLVYQRLWHLLSQLSHNYLSRLSDSTDQGTQYDGKLFPHQPRQFQNLRLLGSHLGSFLACKMKDLPDELWLLTFKRYIAGPKNFDRAENLAALCRVCRKFRSIAQSLLYSFPEMEQVVRPPLFRTLCERPDLAQCATSLSLRGFDGLDPPVDEAFEAARRGCPDAFVDKLRQDIDDGVEEANVPILLTLLPNLKCLDFALYEMEMMNEFFQIAARLRRAGPDQADAENDTPQDAQILPKLKEVCMRHWDTENTLQAWSAADIVTYPGLERLYGFATEWVGPVPSAYASQKLELKKIDIRDSFMDDRGLESILTLCPQLSVLRVSWGESYMSDQDMNLDAMGNALRKHGTNLKVLDLDPRTWLREGAHPNGRIGSLAALSRLKKLAITKKMLLGEDASDSDSDDDGDGDGDDNGNGEDPQVDGEYVLPESIEEWLYYDRDTSMSLNRYCDSFYY